ncbi:MAG: polysaccharide biosynthesis/export family protein, partial [bacterium]|nr:polysaccharide biosynthesis/export family protein [bacterium]
MLIMKKKYIARVMVIAFWIMLVLQNIGAPKIHSQTNLNKKNEFYPGDAMRVSFVDIYKGTDRGAALDIGGNYTIDGRGYIMLPLVGQFKVIGYDRYTLAEKLAEIYKPYFTEPYVAITP